MVSGLTDEGTGNDQRSIDLVDGAAAVCYVTSKELRYRRCGGCEVTVRHARAASGHNIRSLAQAEEARRLILLQTDLLCVTDDV